MIGRLGTVVLDCPDPQALGRFYATMLGWQVVDDDPEWTDIRSEDGQYLSFQRAENLLPPRWPDPAYPQQFHLDIRVDDIASAEREVLRLGATFVADEMGAASGFRVYTDPAGHPFCLCACAPS